MGKLISAIVSILREQGGKCKSTCPQCSERCGEGFHSTGDHSCSNGHSWGGK